MSTHTTRFFAALAAVAAIAWPAGAEDYPGLEDAVRNAPQLKVENVCSPIRTTRGGEPLLVPNPDGKTYDVLMRYYKDYYGPHTTFIIDLATGEVKEHVVEDALFNWGTLGPDGRYYAHRTGEGGKRVWIYDPAKNEISLVPTPVPVGGEVQPICIGTDGMLYGGGSRENTACAYQLDPKTLEVKDLGKIGPSHAPNECWGYSIGVDDRYVYMASGKIPWWLVVLDRQTGKQETLLTVNDARGYIGVSQSRYGVSVAAQETDKPSRYFWAYQGKIIPKEPPNDKGPPWPEPEKVQPWVVEPPKPELGTSRATPSADGKAELWYRNPEDKKNAPAENADPVAIGWKVVKFQVPTFGSPVLEVLAIPDGRVFGSGESYTGNFMYDPKRNSSAHFGPFPLSQYCMTYLGGIVYMCGYPNSVLHAFDVGKPWTTGHNENPIGKPVGPAEPNSNPKQLCYLAHEGAGTHKMWSACVGADGKAYFGGRWYRNGEGGGLGWWDPKAKKAGGVADVFANYQVSYITPAGKYIVISTHGVRDQTGKLPTPDTGRIFVFDTEQMKVVRHVDPVAKALFAGAVVGVDARHVLGLAFNPEERANAPEKDELGHPPCYGSFDKTSILYKLDVETGEVLWKKTVPYAVGFRSNENAQGHDGFDFTLGPDGKVWTYTGAKFVHSPPGKSWHYSYLDPVLVRINPQDGAIEVVGKLDRGGRIAFCGVDIYLSGGCRYLVDRNDALRRVRDVVPAP